MDSKSDQPAHGIMEGQAMGEKTESTGWNGTSVEGEDPYALLRDCNASTR